ncbi:hypothetical protein GCM10010174_69300 [Kutzneria viridogrisea]|uniref:Malate dehydrogenase (Oxaloacetate-decarboxylating) n=1 Tax=Kutzneria viridogrisea TaxID=47990 RepID=A0ABR6BB36_9PSEU|nr:malate dehydrogenase (oxaloacetate-decarboxylating) [Kutzneria viridogrisea]
MTAEVAVVSDGSAIPDASPPATLPLLQDYAELVREHAGLSAVPLAVDSARLAAELCALPKRFRAVFLTHTDPERAFQVQRAVAKAGGPLVITDQDTTAISLTASTLTTLARRGRSPSDSRVVIAGARQLPRLCVLLLAAGVGDIVSWNECDAPVFPLHRVSWDADALICLLDTTTGAATAIEPPRHVLVTTADPACHLLALPGLVQAVLRSPVTSLEVEVLRACAMALAAATPPGRRLPELTEPAVTRAVAYAATYAIHAQHHPRRS